MTDQLQLKQDERQQGHTMSAAVSEHVSNLLDLVSDQMAAEGEVQEANVLAKHLEKQLAEQRKALAAKEKEAGSLAQELKRERAAVDACQQRCDEALTTENT